MTDAELDIAALKRGLDAFDAEEARVKWYETSDEIECVACGAGYSLTPGLEPTALCNDCPHELVPRLITALESARRERDEYVGYIQEMDRRIGEWNKLGVQDVPTLVAERDALKAQLAEARRERDVFSYDRLTMERQRAEAERVTARAEAEQLRAERDALAAELSESHEDHKATCEKALAKGFV